MLEKGKINASELFIMVITFTIGASVLVQPASTATVAKQDAWLVSASATIISLFFAYLYNQLAALYPSMTYIECHEKILGKWLGKGLALLFIFFLFILLFDLLREIGDFFATEILTETPIEVIMVAFLLTSLIGVRLGLEVIFRTVVIFFPWIVTLLILLFLFIIPEIKIENIYPILGDGLKPVMRGIYQTLTIPYVQLVVFLMVTPYVTEKAKIKKAFYWGIFIGGLILTLFVLFSIFVLGPNITARQTYPSYMLGKKISLGNFRIEVFVAIIWILTIYFKVTVYYYGISLGLAQILGLRDYRILLFPLAFLTFSFSIFSYSNLVELSTFITTTAVPFLYTVTLILPLLLLVIGKIKLKRSASKVTKQPLN
ncbi:endospore germination permease [Bacillus sp. EB600]|uniref:GerAB/ArcD/ProY family transporter n=1 Tax=Bacillus sp. EB600 TaxID=2806345 RepID=UPI00210D292C|nr:endospore germination permease [Bacillus sp. EB600]MCQ6281242.1 endospore germination permease [Bacillus sp. EB600]